MAKSKKIYHRNDMRMALSALSLPPRRILWLVLAQLEKDGDGVQAFDANKIFTIKAKEYSQLCEIDESVAYKQLKEGVREIRSHLMEIRESELLSKEEFEKNRRSKDGMVLFTVAKHGYYTDGDGYIEVQLDPIMSPFISKLRNNFTGQFLLSALRLPDGNANKLYLLLREWISSGMSIYKDIEVDDLKSKLGLLDKKAYERFNLFSSSFFLRAVKKIVKATEFKEIKMEIIERNVRRAKKVRISYKYDGQKKDFGDAGFLLGKDKKSKSIDTENNKKNADKKQNLTQQNDNNELKQINGRFYDKNTAEAAGYNWEEY